MQTFKREYTSEYGAAAQLNMGELSKTLKLSAAVYNNHDSEGDGELEIPDVMGMLIDYGFDVETLDDVKREMRRVDEDDSGTMSYWEFINLTALESGIIREPIGAYKRRASKGGTVSLPSGRHHHQIGRTGSVKKKKRGSLNISLNVKRSAKGITVTAKIKAAKDLLAMDPSGLSDPYVKAYIVPDPKKRTKRKTKVVKKTLDPVWNETLEWQVPSENAKDLRVHIAVWDWDRMTSNDFIGCMSFGIEELFAEAGEGGPVDGWYLLLDKQVGAKYNFKAKMADVARARSDSRFSLPGEDGRLPRRSSKVMFDQIEEFRDMHLSKQSSAASRGSDFGFSPDSSFVVDKLDDLMAKPFSIDSFEFIKVLGRGSFGKVFLAEEKESGTLYAIKTLKKAAILADNDVEQTMIEKRVMAISGDPPFITRLEGSFQTQGRVYFVMEPCLGGDLMFHLLDREQFPEPMARFYCAEILCALFFLHEHGVLYRDVKLDNIFVGLDGHLRLGDFGLAKDGMKDKQTATFCGTPDFMAPEIARHEPYNHVADFWSLGIITFDMIAGEAPFDAESEEELMDIIAGNDPVEFPDEFSAPCKSFLGAMLSKDPAKRLGSGPTGPADIKAHEWFKDLDFEKLLRKEIEPPFVPNIQEPRNADYFDDEFTALAPKLTAIDKRVLDGIDQSQFDGFTYMYDVFAEEIIKGGMPAAPRGGRRNSYFGFNNEYQPEMEEEHKELDKVAEEKTGVQFTAYKG